MRFWLEAKETARYIMLVIREEQMKVFQASMLKKFEDKMVIHLRSNFSKEIENTIAHNLRVIVRAGIENAAKYDVTTEDDIRCYLEYMAIYGPDFDTNPKTSWAGDILRLKSIDGAEKMDRISEYDLFQMQGQ